MRSRTLDQQPAADASSPRGEKGCRSLPSSALTCANSVQERCPPLSTSTHTSRLLAPARHHRLPGGILSSTFATPHTVREIWLCEKAVQKDHCEGIGRVRPRDTSRLCDQPRSAQRCTTSRPPTRSPLGVSDRHRRPPSEHLYFALPLSYHRASHSLRLCCIRPTERTGCIGTPRVRMSAPCDRDSTTVIT